MTPRSNSLVAKEALFLFHNTTGTSCRDLALRPCAWQPFAASQSGAFTLRPRVRRLPRPDMVPT